jgi:hypothetical protein
MKRGREKGVKKRSVVRGENIYILEEGGINIAFGPKCRPLHRPEVNIELLPRPFSVLNNSHTSFSF